MASSAATTRALWAVAASNSTVAETVRAQVGPSDPLWWMLREQDADIAERESWMLRVLDALQTDELCPCNWTPGEEVLKPQAA